MIGPGRGKRILDAGCGSGRHSVRLSELGAAVVASETIETLLEMARSKASGYSIEWLDLDIEGLPLGLG
jgi:magnesium-protoporphyrin O-methyltransferase